MKKLNLGCGRGGSGFINVDWDVKNEPDVRHDFNKLPYPFENNEFDYIEAFHNIEHLDKPFPVMKEFTEY